MANFYFSNKITGSIDVTDPDDMYQSATDSLKLLVGGGKNKRLFELDKGAGINRFIFSNGNVDDTIIMNEIQEQVAKYLSYIRIDDIKIESSQYDINGKNITITWSIPEIRQDQVVTVLENIK